MFVTHLAPIQSQLVEEEYNALMSVYSALNLPEADYPVFAEDGPCPSSSVLECFDGKVIFL